MVKPKSCSRCGNGDMSFDEDRFGSRLRCVQCGHSSDLNAPERDESGGSAGTSPGIQLTADECRWMGETWVNSVFASVADGVAECDVHVSGVHRSKVVRGYQVAREFSQRRLTTLDKPTSEKIASKVRHSTEASYVKSLFELWTRWKESNRQ